MKESWGIRVKSSNLGKRNDPATPVLSSDPLIDLSWRKFTKHGLIQALEGLLLIILLLTKTALPINFWIYKFVWFEFFVRAVAIKLLISEGCSCSAGTPPTICGVYWSSGSQCNRVEIKVEGLSEFMRFSQKLLNISQNLNNRIGQLAHPTLQSSILRTLLSEQ